MYIPPNSCDIKKVVNIENPVYQSFKGRYFIGQSNLLSFGFDGYAWGALYNPQNSGVILYVSVVTVTNTSNLPIKSRIYMGSSIPEGAITVTSITPANLAFSPPPKPMVRFLAGQFLTDEITDGIKAFTRIVPSNSTLANEKDGKIVIPPGSSFLTLLVPPGPELVKADIAYGWWEKKI
ncbi:DUF6143 family protein [Clostridium brassicae]|uniref:DUF6143 family protein n=1 Tax=Clostridium brassicae TaxID=2999072 RepID=A0ABT4D728_9CLOT|nr:DUF6143 family protein [Clostridium brassicae]MCY6958097.1 DUF6143 family protein [Clostridium brassicae]